MLKRIDPENIERYGCHYDEPRLWKKLGDVAKRAGSKVVYPVLLLYYILQDKNVPLKHKAAIAGALGYFILPLDLIPDLVPLLGFSDDLAALAACIKFMIANVTPEVKEKANRKLETWF
jgi:uncharacterized membrane protein YkvA (DUF1232 family)